jgi:hypothetical protein
MQPPIEYDSGPAKKRGMSPWLFVGIGGFVCCGGVSVLAAILFPVFAQVREATKTTSCIRNLRAQGLGLQQYGADWDDHFPAGDRWMDALGKYITRQGRFRCPGIASGEGPGAYGYALNDALAGKAMPKIEQGEATPLIFDSAELGKNVAASPETMPSPGRHFSRGSRVNNVYYLSGNTRAVPDGEKP